MRVSDDAVVPEGSVVIDDDRSNRAEISRPEYANMDVHRNTLTEMDHDAQDVSGREQQSAPLFEQDTRSLPPEPLEVCPFQVF